MKGNTQQHDERESEAPGRTLSDDGQTVSVVARANGEGAAEGEASSGDLQAKVERLEDSLLRARADLQNAQRRATTERLDAVRYANAQLMKSLVPIVDDFERALSTASQTANEAALVKGVRLVYENLIKALADHGLETIEALDQPFDPTMHEALMQKPTTAVPSGTVVDQVARGYRLGGRVVRPAKVIVAKAPDGGAAVEPEIDNGKE
jgi:molecular chaperone GrpE